MNTVAGQWFDTLTMSGTTFTASLGQEVIDARSFQTSNGFNISKQ
jgi:hypothetical protein